MFRFYNGGNADDLTLSYSVIDGDKTRTGRHVVRLNSKDFFEVPESIPVKGRQHFTNFDITVPTRKGQFGVIRVSPDAEQTSDTGHIARTDEEAKKLGDEKHEEYLIKLVQEYIDRVEQFRAQGFNPLPAQGYTKYALKALNIEDPVETVRNHVVKAAENDRIAALEAEVKALKKKG